MRNNFMHYLWVVMMAFVMVACGGGGEAESNSNSGSGSDSGSETPTNPEAKDPTFLEFKLTVGANSGVLENDVRCSISNAKQTITSSNVKTKVPIAPGTTLVPSFKVNENHKVYVDGKEQRSGITPQNFSSPIAYKVVNENGVEATYTVTIKFTFSGLPIVSIQTSNGGNIMSKDYWVDATISIDGGSQFASLEPTKIQVAGRGNSTWSTPNNSKVNPPQTPKNPYKIKFEKRTEILGMPKHKRWVL